MNNDHALRLGFLPGVKRYFKTFKKDRNLLGKYQKVIKALELDPTIGTAKTGDLAGVYSIDIRHNKVNYELAYYFEEQEYGKLLLIILTGTRENFYQNLKRNIKTSGINQRTFRK